MYLNSQTFYLDPNSVGNSPVGFLTSVDLFFKAKPGDTNNVSGIQSPTVTVSISDVDTTTYALGAPVFANSYPGTFVTVPWSSVNPDLSANTPTTFTFSTPVPLQSGRRYAINVQADDPGFSLWYAKTGDALTGQANTSAFGGFSGGLQGDLFSYGSDGNINPIVNAQLTYRLRVAQFTSNTATYEMVNGNYEFIYVSNQRGSFIPGETVIGLTANGTGTVSVQAGTNVVYGNGTNFQTANVQPGQYIAVYTSPTTLVGSVITSVSSGSVLTTQDQLWQSNGAANYMIVPAGTVSYTSQAGNTLFLSDSTATSPSYRFNSFSTFSGTILQNTTSITSVSNTQGLFVGQPLSSNTLGLASGTTISSINATSNTITISAAFTGANSTAEFYAKTPIAGVRSGANAYISFLYDLPVSQINPDLSIRVPGPTNVNLSFDLAQTPTSNGSYTVDTTAFETVTNNTTEVVSAYSAKILSRSNEVNQNGYLYGADQKSGVIRATLSTTGTTQYASPIVYGDQLNVFINTNVINNNYSGETQNQGLAAARHISTKVKLDTSNPAQDLLVQVNATLPQGTSIIAYGKLYNSQDPDAFESKQWTQLSSNNVIGPVTGSGTKGTTNLSFTVPSTLTSLRTVSGTVQVSGSTVTGSGTTFTQQLSINDVVKIYNPIIPSDQVIAVVQSVQSDTSLTINSSVSNTSITQPGFNLDVVSDPYVGFLNPQNNNIVRYYNYQLNEFDGYDTFQVKLVMLSGTSYVSPTIHSLTAVALSA